MKTLCRDSIHDYVRIYFHFHLKKKNEFEEKYKKKNIKTKKINSIYFSI